MNAVSGGETLEIHREEGKKCMKTYPYYCQIVSVLNAPNADVTLSYQPESVPEFFFSRDSIIFEVSKAFVYPDLGKDWHGNIAFDFTALQMKNAKMTSNSNIEEMLGEIPSDSDSFFLIFTYFLILT